MEIYNNLVNLGKIVSLRELGKGYIGIKEEYINSQLQKVCDDDNGIKSLRISCQKDKGLFFVELKRFLFKGSVEIPFQVDDFIFNSEVKEITFRFGKEKTFTKSYYSRLLLWFALTIIGSFTRKKDMLKYSLDDNSYFRKNHNGTYTIDLTCIPDLKEYLDKPYWNLVRIDGIMLDDEKVLLRLHKEFAEKIFSIPQEIEYKVKEVKEKSVEVFEKWGNFLRDRLENRDKW